MTGRGKGRFIAALLGLALVAVGCGGPSTVGPSAGGVWTRSPTPGVTSQSIDSLSCPSVSSCVAVGGPTDTSGAGYGWTDDGSSWSAPVVADSSSALLAVSCASPSFCVAPDENGGFTMFNGSSWSAPRPLDPDGVPAALSCPSKSFCLAVGQEGVDFSQGPLVLAA